MANYFYRDANGQRRGPYDEQQLQELEQRGIITATTPLETDRKYLGLADQVPGLKFSFPSQQTLQQASPDFFDIGFTRFISNTWISIIWCIVIFVHFVGALGAMYYAFNTDGTLGAISLLVVPLITAISLLFCRMGLELEVIFFRIESNTRETKEYLREIKEQLEKSERSLQEPQV